MVMSCFTAQV